MTRSRILTWSTVVQLLVLTVGNSAIAPHPERVDRLIDTRGKFSVEYSPGQEAWAELAFERLTLKTSNETAPSSAARHPLSFEAVQEQKEALLTSVARQVGLKAPSDLQRRTFDTFIGYYEILTELYQGAVPVTEKELEVRHVAIWQRDELTTRLSEGETLAGFEFDADTGKGHFTALAAFDGDSIDSKIAEIRKVISDQQVNHTMVYGDGKIKAGFNLGSSPTKPYEDASPPEFEDASISKTEPIVFPIIYVGPFDQTPEAKIVDKLLSDLAAARHHLTKRLRNYFDPALVGVVLHETAEVGLLENTIRSKDRRWLCDGTANYAAWKATHEVFGPELATSVYDVDTELNRYAALQKKIRLSKWPAAERQKEKDRNTDLNRAHYAFAARAMFMIAERHGEDAIPLLWQDVAKIGIKRASAKTFSSALRKRYDDNLSKLVGLAEDTPIP